MPLGIQQVLRFFPARSRKALWGGQQVLTGYKVSEFGNKTKRMFKPNVKTAFLYSETLERKLKLKVTTNVLKEIDTLGGLDNYLLAKPDSKLFSDVGSELRFRIGLIQKQQKLAELQQQRAEVAAARRRRAVEMLIRPQVPAPAATGAQQLDA